LSQRYGFRPRAVRGIARSADFFVSNAAFGAPLFV
jgi:hypothetical protein